MKIGFLQFAPKFGEPSANIRRIEELIFKVEFDLLVLPELANSGYLFSKKEELELLAEEIPSGYFCKCLQNISSQKKAIIVSGICEKSFDGFFNSSVLVKPDGELFTYRKIHLFYEEKKWFKPGNISPSVCEIGDISFGKVKVGMMICFDWIFPETARSLALKGAQIICHPSNLVLPYCQSAMFTRAVENHVFTITANRIGKESNGGNELTFTGQSVIIDPKGNYLAKASVDREECIVVDVNPLSADDKNITELNNIFKDRRVDLYEK